ncbi:DUF294 nucleotidyltransferase-like domain-containing protein [Amaricoccus tamworthensis]|uniref:DUF294 nucleotidyltransferase-like domain-containing protein n=1 Tax=Amaricoccus tamworthensis TaxID=57002 RepID=UPI003C7D80FB
MDKLTDQLAEISPFDTLPVNVLQMVASQAKPLKHAAGEVVYGPGQTLEYYYLIISGEVEILDPNKVQVSLVQGRHGFGSRNLLRNVQTTGYTRAVVDVELLLIPAEVFLLLVREHRDFGKFYAASRPAAIPAGNDLATVRVSDIMTRNPLKVGPNVTIQDAAAMMRDARVSSLGVVADGTLTGLVTARILTMNALARGLSPDTKVGEVCGSGPLGLPSSSLGTDVLQVMLDNRVAHVPIVDNGRFVGIVSQTDVTRFQAVTSAAFLNDMADAKRVSDLAQVTARIPQLLAQSVASGKSHTVVTRLITDIADGVTKRLVRMAEEELGPPPVPYLWLACGSQGRREQTGVSDQDNCLMLDDAVTPEDMGYFEKLADFVCDGLNECGYVYCPGDMMASNPRWRQPVRVWREYFAGWVQKPDPMAQMLASVMFDLRPIAGTVSLFENLQRETLEMASRNSIFVAHMVSNSLKHAPPLGLLRGFATIRSGEHKNRLDMKHNGVVPIVDLGRVYALQGRLTPANTMMRLKAAEKAGVISASGAGDLVDAYDLIAETRLLHQARQIREGEAPDNFVSPNLLSAFERNHLRDAFLVVRTMQSALAHGRATAG